MWETWTTGRKDWNLGKIVPDEILYYLNGPAIFTCRIGLQTYLFFKSDEAECCDYYVASQVTDRELKALQEGRLSVRGALSQPRCWLFETDFDLNVQRYDEKSESEVRAILPKPGVPLQSAFQTAADSINQTDALFAFKFYGAELSDEGMPFSTFKSIVDNVYNIVRTALTPASLSNGRDSRFMDFPVRQPDFASLLIAIDNPVLDATQLRSRDRTRNLDPVTVVREAQERGRSFADQVERTVDLAASGQLSNQFASEHFLFLQQIVDILPASDSDVSKLQFSSNFLDEKIFVEVDAAIGDRIRESFHIAERRNIRIRGNVTAVLSRSKTIRLETEYNREVTCVLESEVFDILVADSRLKIGVKIDLRGMYTSRTNRDLMKVEGMPIFF